MVIPVSSVVSVNIASGASFPQRAGFGTLNIVTSETGVIDRAERIRFYTNLDGVSKDWPANSEVIVAATSYFSQNPSPNSLKVSTRYEEDQPGLLRGGSVISPTELLTVSDGSFTISIDGVSADITALDFNDTELTLDDIASTIQTAIQTVATGGFASALCYHDGFRFFVTSGTTGSSSTVSYCSPVSPSTGTDISSLLKFRLGEAKTVSGIVGETITASLNAIQNTDEDWYGLVFTKEVRDLTVINSEPAVLAAAAWTEARFKAFGNTINDVNSLDDTNTSDIGSALFLAGYDRTLPTYSSFPDQYPSCSVLARAFTVNFSQPKSTTTLKFKDLPGITVENLTSSQYASLKSKNINALISVGQTDVYGESTMSSGKFFDQIHGLDWLTNAIQTNVFGYLKTRTTKVPYTDKGASALAQQVTKALDEAVLNGLVAPGTTIDGEFLGTGYRVDLIPVANINPSDKSARNYPGISFVIIGAGAIHSVQINGTFEI